MTTPFRSELSSTLAAWGDQLAAQPADSSHWLTYWMRVNEEVTSHPSPSGDLYEAILLEAFTERLLILFLELKGVRTSRLARINYVFGQVLRRRFRTPLTSLLAEEVTELLNEHDFIKPEVVRVQDDTFLAVSSEYAIVTSGGARRFFPCVDEAVGSPKYGPILLDAISEKVEEARTRSKKAGREITRLCFIEKSFGPVGLISLTSELVRRFRLPAMSYRSYAWNAKETRISSGHPESGENVCAIYDVAVSGSMLHYAATYLKQHCDASMSSAVVYYDLEEGAKDRLGAVDVELFSVSKKRNFLRPLEKKYRDIFNEPLENPRTDVDVDASLVRKVQDVLAVEAAPEENSIIDAFESYIDRHSRELEDGRIIAGARILSWSDVAREMRDRTSFGSRYLKALTESAIENFVGRTG